MSRSGRGTSGNVIHRGRDEERLLSLASLIICFQLILVMLHWLCIKIQLNMNQIGFSLTNKVALAASPFHRFLPPPLLSCPLTRRNISYLTSAIYVKYDIFSRHIFSSQLLSSLLKKVVCIHPAAPLGPYILYGNVCHSVGSKCLSYAQKIPAVCYMDMVGMTDKA